MPPTIQDAPDFVGAMKTTPRPYQAQVVRQLLDMPAAFLNADPGTGKTWMSIAYAAMLYRVGVIKDVWVFAPNLVHAQWIHEQVPMHLAIESAGLVYSAEAWGKVGYQKDVAQWHRAQGLRFLAINFETLATSSGVERLREFYKQRQGPILLIADESSRGFKSPSARRSKVIHSLAEAPGIVRRLCLTGTPITNSPFDAWSQYEILRKNYFGMNFFAFEHTYGLLVKRQMNGRRFDVLAEDRDFRYVRKLLDVPSPSYEAIAARTGLTESSVRWLHHHPEAQTPYKNLDDLKARMNPVTLIVRKEDVLPELPEKIYTTIYAELSPEQSKAYKELAKNYATEYEGQELSITVALSLLLRLQQITGGFFPHGEGETPIPFKRNPKLDTLLDDLEESDGGPVIIFAIFRAEVEAIAAALRKKYPGKRTEMYYGGTSSKDKEAIKADFSAGAVDFLVANQTSAGIGLNLQRSALTYFYSQNFSFEGRVQAEDRTHRLGIVKSPHYRDIVIPGTVDDKIRKAFLERKDIADYFRAKDFLSFIA